MKGEYMKGSSIFKKNRDIVTRKIENETILVPLYKTSEELDCIYTLNDIAGRIWELIDGKKSMTKIEKILLREYDVTEKKLNAELAGLLKDLKDIKAII